VPTDAPPAFFSYCRDDKDFALRLAEDLKSAGANVWLDQLDIVPGQRWDRAVEDALKSCPRMLVILSPVSVNSTNVMDEVSFALEEQKTVIPILYRDCVIPFRLRRLHYVDFRSDYERRLKELLRTLVPQQKSAQEGQAFEEADREQKRGEQPGARTKAGPQTASSATQADKVLKLGSGKELLTLSGHGDSVEDVTWSPDGKRLATGSDDGTAKVWAAETGKELLTLLGHSGIRSVSWNWNPDEAWLATGSVDSRVTLWDADTGKELNYETPIGCGVAWRPKDYREERYWLATVGGGSGILLWDIRTRNQLLIHYDEAIISMAWSHDGNFFATGGWETDKLAKVWDVETRKELRSLSGHNGGIYGVSWSPDGSRLTTGSNDGTAKVWDVRSCKQVLTLTLKPPGGWNEVWAVAWSPNGKWLATGSQDGIPRVWDAETGKELLRLRGHTQPIKSVAWSPDGQRLATSSEDKTTKVWEVTKNPSP
jgi:WD40 repeat protein